MKTNRAKFLPLMRKFFYKQISQPMYVFFSSTNDDGNEGNDGNDYEDYEMYHFATSL